MTKYEARVRLGELMDDLYTRDDYEEVYDKARGVIASIEKTSPKTAEKAKMIMDLPRSYDENIFDVMELL